MNPIESLRLDSQPKFKCTFTFRDRPSLNNRDIYFETPIGSSLCIGYNENYSTKKLLKDISYELENNMAPNHKVSDEINEYITYELNKTSLDLNQPSHPMMEDHREFLISILVYCTNLINEANSK